MFKKNVKSRLKLKEFGIPILFFVGGFLLWEALVPILNIPDFLLPKPSKIIFEIITRFPFFLGHLGFTILAAIIGYFIADLLAFILAVIFVHSKTAERGLYPYALAVKISPVIALAPFIILWFGIGITSNIVIAVLICFFPILVNTMKGLKTVEEGALELLKSLSASQWQIFLKLRLPGSLPFLFPALKIAVPLAITGALVGEFLSSDRGIGYLILLHQRIFDPATSFAALFVIVLAGILFFLLISFIEKKVLFWQKSGGI